MATKINRYYNNFKLYTRERGSRVEYKNTFITSVSNINIYLNSTNTTITAVRLLSTQNRWRSSLSANRFSTEWPYTRLWEISARPLIAREHRTTPVYINKWTRRTSNSILYTAVTNVVYRNRSFESRRACQRA